MSKDQRCHVQPHSRHSKRSSLAPAYRLDDLLEADRFTGLSAMQVDYFIDEATEILSRYPDAEKGASELKV